MRGTNGGAVIPLLRSLEAEPNAVLSHAGALVERLALQPAARQLLNAWAAFGDKPHPATEGARELGDGVERTLAGRRRQRGFVASAEKGGICLPGSIGSADDHSANVDAENRL